MKLLLSGFQPFAASPVNPSACVVEAMAARTLPGIELYTTILPVEHERGPHELLRRVDECHPDAVVCLGEAGRRTHLSIERVALNLLDYAIPDNVGNLITDRPICPDGPAAYFVTLPARQMLAGMREAGVPAELSLSAGTFLCNEVLYELLHHLALSGGRIAAGFIHLPYLPEQAARQKSAAASMSLQTMVTGISAGLDMLRAETRGLWTDEKLS